MSTRVRNKVVPSTPTASTVTTTTGQEVQGNPPATIVAAGGVAASTSPTPGGVTAAKVFREALTPQREALARFIRATPAVSGRRGSKVDARRIAVLPRIAELLREFPHLAPNSNPDDIVAWAAEADAMLLVVSDLQALAKALELTVRLDRIDAWNPASAAYTAACHQAKTDVTMASKIAPIRDALKRGPRVDTAAAAAAAASHVAGKAQSRASKAQQRAVAASNSHARTVQAHAANTTVRGTSPVPLANPQGPAASADVAPQGPAPGR